MQKVSDDYIDYDETYIIYIGISLDFGRSVKRLGQSRCFTRFVTDVSGRNAFGDLGRFTKDIRSSGI